MTNILLSIVKRYGVIMVRKKAKQTLIQTGLRLEPEILDKLRKSPRGVSEEIRDRLIRTFFEDEIDPRTRELAAGVMQLAQDIRHDKSFDWYSHEKAHETLVEAIKALLGSLKPKREGTHAVTSDLMWGDDDPVTLGRSIARAYLRRKVEMAKSLQEMVRLHKGEKS